MPKDAYWVTVLIEPSDVLITDQFTRKEVVTMYDTMQPVVNYVTVVREATWVDCGVWLTFDERRLLENLHKIKR